MRRMTEIVRCFNCMNLYGEGELLLMQNEGGDRIHACPLCKTDAYLTDIEVVE